MALLSELFNELCYVYVPTLLPWVFKATVVYVSLEAFVATEFNKIFLGRRPRQDAKVHAAGCLRKFHWTVVYVIWWQFFHC